MLAHHVTEHPGQFEKSYRCPGYVRTASLVTRDLPWGGLRQGQKDSRTWPVPEGCQNPAEGAHTSAAHTQNSTGSQRRGLTLAVPWELPGQNDSCSGDSETILHPQDYCLYAADETEAPTATPLVGAAVPLGRGGVGLGTRLCAWLCVSFMCASVFQLPDVTF